MRLNLLFYEISSNFGILIGIWLRVHWLKEYFRVFLSKNTFSREISAETCDFLEMPLSILTIPNISIGNLHLSSKLPILIRNHLYRCYACRCHCSRFVRCTWNSQHYLIHTGNTLKRICKCHSLSHHQFTVTRLRTPFSLVATTSRFCCRNNCINAATKPASNLDIWFLSTLHEKLGILRSTYYYRHW